MIVCNGCKTEIEGKIIPTDLFNRDAVENYCEDCFYQGTKKGFNESDFTCYCGEQLVLVHDKEEVIAQALFDHTIDYECPLISQASAMKDNANLYDGHTDLSLYVTQPTEDN